VSNILTDWRQALMALLDSNLQGGDFTVVAGKRDGLSRERKLACVYVPKIPTDNKIFFARPPMVIRAWVAKPKQPRPDEPLDPEPVEQLAVDLMALLQPVQSTLLDGIVFWVADVEIDYDDWGVQATLTSWTENPATLPVA
jgi:hypothetical protein